MNYRNVKEDQRFAPVLGNADRLFLGADATFTTPGDAQN
jgi:hypothetical protein